MRECIVTKMDIIKRYQIMSSFIHIGIPEKNIISDVHFKTEISNIILYLFIHHHKETLKQEKRLSWFALYGDFEKAAWEKGQKDVLCPRIKPHRSTPIQIQLM